MANILPFLDSSPWYNMIDFNRPWDHPRNAPIFRISMPCLLNPAVDEKADERGFALSHYAGNSQLFGVNSSFKLEDLPLGMSGTVLAGEIAEDVKAWGGPGNWRDPAAPLNSGPNSFGRYTRDGASLLMADGSVRFVANGADTAMVRPAHKPTRDGRRNPSYSLEHRMLRPDLRAMVQVDNNGRIVALWVPSFGDKFAEEKTTLQDDDFKLFGVMHDLEFLSAVAGREISDAALDHLAGLRKLKSLKAWGSFSDRGLEHLEVLTNLKLLDLKSYSPAMTAAGISRLRTALPECDVPDWRQPME